MSMFFHVNTSILLQQNDELQIINRRKEKHMPIIDGHHIRIWQMTEKRKRLSCYNYTIAPHCITRVVCFLQLLYLSLNWIPKINIIINILHNSSNWNSIYFFQLLSIKLYSILWNFYIASNKKLKKTFGHLKWMLYKIENTYFLGNSIFDFYTKIRHGQFAC